MSLTIGQDVKSRRADQGWSQSDLSSLSGLSVKTIQRMENDKGTPSLETAKALGAVFDNHFSRFLASEEISTKKCDDKDNAAPKKPTSSQKSFDVTPSLRYYAIPYWWLAAIFLIVAIIFGSLTKLHMDMRGLTKNFSSLATTKSSGLDTAQSLGYPRPRSATGTVSSYFDYFADSVLTEGSLIPGRSIDQPLSLLELLMLRDTATIVSYGAGLARLNSGVTLPAVLASYMQCYNDARILSDQANHRILKMENCIYVALADADWTVYPAMSLALKELSEEMKAKGPLVRQLKLLHDNSADTT